MKECGKAGEKRMKLETPSRVWNRIDSFKAGAWSSECVGGRTQTWRFIFGSVAETTGYTGIISFKFS